MTAWHEDARFDVFTKCDVYIEDGHYLYVENQAYNYDGGYNCVECNISDNSDGSKYYIWSSWSGADNGYIIGLEKAPWDIAREIIERNLARWESHEDKDKAEIIEDARWYLMNDATEDEVFTYC